MSCSRPLRSWGSWHRSWDDCVSLGTISTLDSVALRKFSRDLNAARLHQRCNSPCFLNSLFVFSFSSVPVFVSQVLSKVHDVSRTRCKGVGRCGCHVLDHRETETSIVKCVLTDRVHLCSGGWSCDGSVNKHIIPSTRGSSLTRWRSMVPAVRRGSCYLLHAHTLLRCLP